MKRSFPRVAFALTAALLFAMAGHAETAKKPALQVKTLDGASFDLASQRGKWVIVNFWATWCSPCIKEMPDISQFVAARSDAGALGSRGIGTPPASQTAATSTRNPPVDAAGMAYASKSLTSGDLFGWREPVLPPGRTERLVDGVEHWLGERRRVVLASDQAPRLAHGIELFLRTLDQAIVDDDEVRHRIDDVACTRLGCTARARKDLFDGRHAHCCSPPRDFGRVSRRCGWWSSETARHIIAWLTTSTAML